MIPITPRASILAAILLITTVPGVFSETMIGANGIDTLAVETYTRIFIETDARLRIESAFEFAKYFITFVRSEIEARGLPPELAYLPIIESGYNPRATSPSGAAGIWQFMENTSEEFGLYVGTTIDERRDVWKSTRAALTKLENDYRRFGSWELALGAYNCGSNCIQKAIDKYGSTDYWFLARAGALPGETVAYVPKFLAILDLIELRDSLGYESWEPDTTEWTRLPVERPVHLRLVADAAGIDYELLSYANSELVSDATPPDWEWNGRSHGADESYYLKVPVEFAEIINSTLSDPEVQMSDYMVHRIKPGDTLSTVARKYGVSVEAVRNYNPGVQPRFLQINTGLIIPGTHFIPGVHRHVVQAGETLWGIAVQYRTTVEHLIDTNKITDPNRIYPGLALSVPMDIR